MAVSKEDDLTQATGITTDLVLGLGEHHSAQRIRKVQTGLTNAARELRSLVQGQYSSLEGRLGAHLTHEQRELLTQAARLLDSIKYNVEHAKERKAREEKAAAKLHEQREQQAKQMTARFLDLPIQTVEQQIDVLKLYLVARSILTGSMMDSDYSLREKMETPAPKWQSSEAYWRISHVTDLIADLRYCVEYHLVHRDQTPAARLEQLQKDLAEGREAALATPGAEHTLKVWTDALQQAAFVKGLLPDKASSLGGAA